MPTFLETLTDQQIRMTPGNVLVVFGAQSARGLFDDETQVLEDETGRDVIRRTRSVGIRTGTLTGLVEGSTVTVDGVTYQVRRVLTMEDGLMTRLLVTRADL